jgi:4-amino-4-deoxy-L-arabinose transferase-like glycosyltransferase
MESRYTASTKLALALLTAILAVQVYQAATQPVSTVEAYGYDRFVRPTTRQVLDRELLNHDVLYTLLEKRSVGLFHVSPFSVRLPSLLFAILYLWSVWQLARLLLGAGRLFLVAVVLAALIPLHWDCFACATGVGTALALELCAVWLTIKYLKLNHIVKQGNLNLAGACLGLSVAARPEFAMVAVALGLSFLVALAVQRRWALWTDRVLIPALVVALVFLVLPLSHAHAIPEITPHLTLGEAAQLESVLNVLRASAGANHIRIGASPATEPILNFYRAQHRVNTWDRANRSLSSERFDYYLLSTADTEWVEQRHLIVLYQDADFVLARRSYDAM